MILCTWSPNDLFLPKGRPAFSTQDENFFFFMLVPCTHYPLLQTDIVIMVRFPSQKEVVARL